MLTRRLSNLHLGKIIRGAKERTLSSEGIVYARKVNPRESCKLHKRFHRWHSCKTLLPIPSGDSAVCMCTRACARYNTCNDSALFPSAFPADFRCAVAHSCSRTPRFLLLISVANATRSSRALARCQSTIPRSHFRSRSGNEAKSILISFLFESLPLNLIHFFSYVLLLESMIDRSMERAFFFESSKNGYLIRVLEI